MPSELIHYIKKFLSKTGLPPDKMEFQTLAGDGSVRLFHRVLLPESDRSFIAMCNPPVNDLVKKENLAYVMIGKHLFQAGIPVPEIFLHDLNHGWFIMQDFGVTHLQDEVVKTNDPVPIFEKVLETLFQFQIQGIHNFNPEWCCQTKAYDITVMRQYESDYFRTAFLKNYLGLKSKLNELDTPFEYLANTASRADTGFLLHHDFQSRNLMIQNGNVGIIDWQGARPGPLCYDLGSLLIDPYTRLSKTQKKVLFNFFLKLIQDHEPFLVTPFRKHYPYLAIQRNLQILGAFAYLSKTQKKRQFETHIPYALKGLQELLEELNDPKLTPLLDRISGLKVPEKAAP